MQLRLNIGCLITSIQLILSRIIWGLVGLIRTTSWPNLHLLLYFSIEYGVVILPTADTGVLIGGVLGLASLFHKYIYSNLKIYKF